MTKRRLSLRPTPTDESGHERAECGADTKADRDEPQDIRTAKARKARVVQTVDEWRECQRQDEERGEQGAFLPSFHDGSAYHRRTWREHPGQETF